MLPNGPSVTRHDNIRRAIVRFIYFFLVNVLISFSLCLLHLCIAFAVCELLYASDLQAEVDIDQNHCSCLFCGGNPGFPLSFQLLCHQRAQAALPEINPDQGSHGEPSPGPERGARQRLRPPVIYSEILAPLS